MPVVTTSPTDFVLEDDDYRSHCEEVTKYDNITQQFKRTSDNDECKDLTRQVLALDDGYLPDCDFNDRNLSGETFLMVVVKHIKSDFSLCDVHRLIHNGAQINLTNYAGWTALMYAVQNAYTTSTPEVVEWLIDEGADVNQQTLNILEYDHAGWTPLMFAVKYNPDGETRIIQKLVDARADVDIRTMTRRTVFDFTLNSDIQEILLKSRRPKHIDLSTISLDKWTAGTKFRIVIERISPLRKVDRSELATITVEHGDVGAIAVAMTEDYS